MFCDVTGLTAGMAGDRCLSCSKEGKQRRDLSGVSCLSQELVRFPWNAPLVAYSGNYT